jgi:2-polyprenyl-3-methyl-5-hydroxy-6-metoxy-1,4-benzoquinol methylase
MADMVQLNKLLSVLKLGKDNKILDMGCGMGVISEYISDATNAHVTGLDFADKVIKRAQMRTKRKKDRLVFKIGNIKNPLFLKNSFDTIIAIDTLYFVKDLEKTVAKMKSLLTPLGQMGIFYSQAVKLDESPGLLKPKGTKLACVLTGLKLRFRTWNYTKSEMSHWKKRKRIALKLMSAFKSEGNLRICKELIKEAEYVLKFVDSRRISRYLYHVQLS